MRFEWDEAKDKANLLKHGFTFDLAREIFEGDVVTLEDARFAYGEKRMIAIGRLMEKITLTVIYTERKNMIRIISARKANKKERMLYEKTFT